jgi:hypothetical protein
MSKILITPITPFFFLIGLLFCAPVISFSQNDQLMENGAVFKFKRHWYKHNMVYGTLLQNDFNIQNIETVSGDTVSFPIDSARKYYLPEQITLCKNGRYHYASGKIRTFSMGVSRDHVNLDFVYGFRINRHFDIGIGTGMDHNAFSFYTVDDFHLVNIVGTPLYIQGKYNLYRKRRIIYLKAKVGMTNNSETANIVSVNNGIVMEGGIGMLFPSRLRSRFYFEFSQYTSHAKGIANVASSSILSDVEFDVWFHRFLFTVGVEFGK